MKKPRAKSSLIVAIIFLLVGTIFVTVGKLLPSPEDILDNGGEEVNAVILEIDQENTYTKVQIDDEDSFYDGEIVEVSQYASSLHEGGTTTVYYDGETLLLASVSGMSKIFVTIGRVIQALGGVVLLIFIIRLIIFVVTVGVAGLAIGSVAKEAKQQQQFNNQFYGNPAGRTNPYDTQNYPQYGNQQYQQPYQQSYNNSYGQQYNNQQYQQTYNQQYNQYKNQQQQDNNYYNQ